MINLKKEIEEQRGGEKNNANKGNKMNRKKARNKERTKITDEWKR